eukprot:CAMPEP_0114488480 /NCGR_PEP_ID=MMETSP0109-20121206/1354_1 /TAXON_ID=29199 /ORGANISM="Chlorarachnion reptans, Strain CCCM449" /LENGTH=332 /DNA_ID=CAMNT_0001664879 /DNA_START=280 /DNA_END=1279 /DNA_ORIENTATION=-
MALGNSTNKLFIIGLGLGDPTDISLKGLAAIKMCKTVYLERYTSVLFCDVGDLEALYGTKIEIADRDFVENNADIMLQRAKEENVAFLVAGSPLAATTHYDLILRARDAGVSVHLIPNASILDAVGVVGLQLYRFGQTVSIPWFTETWKPESFVENIEMNRKRYLHSLCLLDIQMKEPDPELLAKGETVYMPPRFMNLTTAVEQILHVLKARRIRTGKTSSVRRGWGSLGPNSYAVGIARAGTSEMKIIYGTLEQLSRANIGPPLHSLIIPAPNLHAMEIEALRHFRVSNRTRAGKRGRRARLEVHTKSDHWEDARRAFKSTSLRLDQLGGG